MIKINTGDSLTLGYRGEHLARCCELEIPEDWVAEFGESGEIEIHVIRSSETQAYKAAAVESDITARKAVWSITSVETSFAGSGKAQLCYIINGVVVKSKIFSTYVRESNSAAEPVDPPPPSVVSDAVDRYIEQYVDVVTTRGHGSEGNLLKSNGDGTYSWLAPDVDPIIDSDEGFVLIPKTTLNRLAEAVRYKTGYEGNISLSTMAQILYDTQLWSTEQFALGLAPAGEITINSGIIPNYGMYGRANISKVNLPYCGRLGTSAFANSTVSIVDAPNLASMAASAFASDTSLTAIHMPKLVNIEGTGCFSGCSALTSASLPELKYITGTTFSNNYALTEVYLPKVVNAYNNGTTSDSVFSGCRVLGRVEMPKYEGIMRSAWFDGCYNIKEIILPKVKGFTGTNNFRNCYALEKLYAPECTQWAANNFSGCNIKKLCLYVKPTTITATSFNAPALEDIYVPWSQGEVANAPWGAPSSCRVHYNTQYDEDGEPIE